MLTYNSSFCLELAGMLVYFKTARGLTTFNLWAILQIRGNSWATSKKMMYKTTDSQQLNLKKGRYGSV